MREGDEAGSEQDYGLCRRQYGIRLFGSYIRHDFQFTAVPSLHNVRH
jgi:hypothetical protein